MARNLLLVTLLAALLVAPLATAVNGDAAAGAAVGAVEAIAPLPLPLSDVLHAATTPPAPLADPVLHPENDASSPDGTSDADQAPPEARDDGETRYDEEDEAERQGLLGLRDDVLPAGPPGDVDHLVQKNVKDTTDEAQGLLATVGGIFDAALGAVGGTLEDLTGPQRDARGATFRGATEAASGTVTPFGETAAAAAAPAMGLLFATTVVTLPGTGILPAWWRRALGIGGFAGYTRLRRAHLLEQEVRGRIHGAVEANPGVPTPKLAEEAGVSRATATYHLRVLEREGYVASRRVGRSRHYFPGGTVRQVDPQAQAVLQHPTADALATAVQRNPGVDQSTLCGELDLSPSLAHWHLQRLVDVGLVAKQRDGRKVRYHPGEASC